MIFINSCSSIVSQTLLLLLHPKCHSHLFAFHSPSYCIVLSLHLHVTYNLGNLCLRVTSVTHLSSQYLILLLVSIDQPMLLSNQFCCCPSPQILHKSCHHLVSSFALVGRYRFLHYPYFDSNTSFHSHCFSTPNLHFHLVNKVVLNFSISLISNPPSSLGLHIVSHFIQGILCLSYPHSQRNFIYIFL